jgi:hypothetical protein
MGLEDLRTDQLPLPDTRELVRHLVITAHAEQRFRERTRDLTGIRRALQRSAETKVSRHRPSWQITEPGQNELPLYLLFSLPDGDQGCLLLNYHGRDSDRFVAVTFIARDSTIGNGPIRIKPLDRELLEALASGLRVPIDRLAEADLDPGLIKAKAPAWLSTRKEADAWYCGPGWAGVLDRYPIGGNNPYHYHWGRLYFQRRERKERSRRKHRRRHKQDRQ